ncbi:MAG: nucleoside hydrolase [Bacillota bacterium]
MKNIIFDCDNTFGVPGCDVDDGLALLYLLGSEKANLLGITCTFGNSDLNTVYQTTKSMLQDIGRSGIPFFRGCEKPGKTESEAVDFLVQTVNEHAGNVSLLATGSLTNLYGAYRKDNLFFTKINKISLMGGITAPLRINGKTMDELNFSIDAQASLCVFENARNISIATGNHCLDSHFSREGFERRLGGSALPVARYIYRKAAYWYDCMKDYMPDGIVVWDVTAAAQLLEEDLFDRNPARISPSLDSLRTGSLIGMGEPLLVDLPRIKDPAAFEEHVYRTYFQFQM